MQAAFDEKTRQLFVRDGNGNVSAISDRDTRYYAIAEAIRNGATRVNNIPYHEHERYAAAQEGGGHWVTMGSQAGEDGEKHGGTPIFIKGDKIAKGPSGTVGKSPDELARSLPKKSQPSSPTAHTPAKPTQLATAKDELKSSTKTTQLAPAAPAQKMKSPDDLAKSLPSKQSPQPQPTEQSVGSTKLANGQSVSFIPHPNQGPNETTIMVDTAKMDKSFSKEPEYLPSGAKGESEIEGRRSGVEEFVSSGKPVQASRVALGANGQLDFIDGRHRFAVLRDNGSQQVAVTVPKSQVAEFQKQFGQSSAEATTAPGSQPQATQPATQPQAAPQRDRIAPEEARQLLDDFIRQSQVDRETGLPLIVKGEVQRIKRMNPGADEDHLTSVAQLALVEAAQKVQRGREKEFPGLAKAAIANALTKDYESQMAQKRGADKTQQFPAEFDAEARNTTAPDYTDIQEAVSKLNPEQQVIAAGIMEGKNFDDIGKELGWSKASVSREFVKVREVLGPLLSSSYQMSPDDKERYKRPDDKPYKFSSTQLNITSGKTAKAIRAMSDSIPDADLSEEGREDKPHITVKYGLHTDNASKVEKIIRGFGPIKVRFGTTKIFPAKEKDSQRGGEAQDVVYVSVDSERLRELNKLISDELECTDTHPSYVPHVCLAYTKPGTGQKYVGMVAVDGEEMTFDELQFSSVDKEKTVISLAKSHRYEYGPRHQPPKRLEGAVARLHALSEYAEEIDDEALEDEVTGIAREFSADDLKTIARKFGIKRGISTKAKTLQALLDKVCEGCAA